jgi:aminopeptidase-like protein
MRRSCEMYLNDEQVVEMMDSLLRDLFPLRRSLTGPSNREAIDKIAELLPVNRLCVPSGTRVFDWTVPQEWVPSRAEIWSASGELLLDAMRHPLSLVNYSRSFTGHLSLTELLKHCHLASTPNAIPYRTSYYVDDWGFCLTANQRHALENDGGPFEVVIEADLKPGTLDMAELVVPGKSAREVLISSYFCHPAQANDGLSGVVLSVALALRLQARCESQLTYRFVWVPETIGALAYCWLREPELKGIDCGFVVTTTGANAPLAFKGSWDSSHRINRYCREVLQGISDGDYGERPFSIHGSDERQYSSPGFRVNMVTIGRGLYYDYPEYHTSFDDLSLVTGRSILKSLHAYEGVTARLESEVIYRRTEPRGEPMLSRYGMYYKTGGATLPVSGSLSSVDLALWILFLTDGRTPTEEISHRLGCQHDQVLETCRNLVSRGILEQV